MLREKDILKINDDINKIEDIIALNNPNSVFFTGFFIFSILFLSAFSFYIAQYFLFPFYNESFNLSMNSDIPDGFFPSNFFIVTSLSLSFLLSNIKTIYKQKVDFISYSVNSYLKFKIHCALIYSLFFSIVLILFQEYFFIFNNVSFLVFYIYSLITSILFFKEHRSNKKIKTNLKPKNELKKYNLKIINEVDTFEKYLYFRFVVDKNRIVKLKDLILQIEYSLLEKSDFNRIEEMESWYLIKRINCIKNEDELSISTC